MSSLFLQTKSVHQYVALIVRKGSYHRSKCIFGRHCKLHYKFTSTNVSSKSS